MADELSIEKSEQAAGLNKWLNKTLLNTLDEGTYFTLPQQTITSLDILPKLKLDGTPDSSSYAGSGSRSNTTIYAVLNKCRTTSGQRLLALWIQNPLMCKDKIDLRLDIVQHLVENSELRTICYDDYLRKIPDLLKISFRISKEKCSLLDLIKVYQACKSIESLCAGFQQTLKTSDIETPNAVQKLFQWALACCTDLSEFKTLIEDTIDLDNVDESGEYMVKPNSDSDIARVSVEIGSLSNLARKELSHVARDIGLEADKSIKLETDTERGFAFKVTKNNEQAVRGNSDYAQLSLVKKDGYRFTSRTLTKLSSKYVNAKEEYHSLAKNVIHDIISKAVVFDSEVLEFSMSVTLLDVFVALSVSALQNNYIRPLILDSEGEKLTIERMRHPCIENQPDIENYIPNDISMSKDNKKFFVITGPNMGGKSTFIKSVGICIIMAQCGSMIPAEDARITVIDGVYTRVGAGDKQMEGISTFMEEMLDMSFILENATKYSLVIIDELGRGTSTFDGFGLAWSISRHLAEKTKCFTLFATHFHELTEMEEDIATVGNLHVKAICQDDKLTMLFNVDEGICDESYGINVAQYTRFPDHVVKLAREKLKQFEEVSGFSDKKKVREFVRGCVQEYMTRSAST